MEPELIPERRHGRRRSGSFYLRGISADLKDAFKGYCGSRGYSMKEALAFLMKDAIKRNRRLKMREGE